MFYIDASTINRMHNDLKVIVPHQKPVELYNYYIGNLTKEEYQKSKFKKVTREMALHSDKNYFGGILDDDCAYQCSKTKSKIRFIPMKFSWWSWKHNERLHSFVHKHTFLWLYRYIDEYYSHRTNKPISFKDMYFNYMIDGTKNYVSILEGRPLMCPFDEDFLQEDHSSIITIGIDDCYALWSEDNKIITQTTVDLISDLLTNLKEKDMLIDDYVLEVPDICKNTLLVERIRRITDMDRVTFYPIELLKKLNISTILDHKTISKFTFSPEYSIESDSKSTSIRQVIFPFSSNYSLNDYPVFLTNVSKINVRFHVTEHGDESFDTDLPSNSCISREQFVREYWQVVMNNLGEKSSSFNTSLGNYYAFYECGIVYGQIPLNYFNNLESTDLVVNIIVNDRDFNFNFNYEELLLWYSEAYESIRIDIMKRINYSRVDFQLCCFFKGDIENPFVGIPALFTYDLTDNYSFVKYTAGQYNKVKNWECDKYFLNHPQSVWLKAIEGCNKKFYNYLINRYYIE